MNRDGLAASQSRIDSLQKQVTALQKSVALLAKETAIAVQGLEAKLHAAGELLGLQIKEVADRLTAQEVALTAAVAAIALLEEGGT